MGKPKIDKHFFISRHDSEALERDILNRRYFERYMVVRQFVYGVVVDMACGCGYGSYLLAKNPDVTRLYGVDSSEEAIDFAQAQYANERIRFLCQDINSVRVEPVSTLVSLETIEHLEDPQILNDFAVTHRVENLIISYPSKKTTHYNSHHLWDLKTQDLCDIFSGYTPYREFTFAYDTCIVCLVRHDRADAAPEARWRPRGKK